jgi:hypothetical protein
MRWLCEELSYIDNPKTDLEDISTGKYLQALQELSQSVRQMYQDGEMHVQTDSLGRIIKIIKKRDPEFGYDRQEYFLLNKTGKKIPVTEEEMDHYLQIEHNSEDIYAQEELEFVSLEALGQDDRDILDEDLFVDDIEDLSDEYDPEVKACLHSQSVTPMDRWDVIFDATEYLNVMKQIMTSRALSLSFLAGMPGRVKSLLGGDISAQDNGSNWVKNTYFQLLEIEREEIISLVQDAAIYSAPWFIPKADKRNRTKGAKIAMEKVASCQTKSEVGKLAYRNNPMERMEKNHQEMQASLQKEKDVKKRIFLAAKVQKLSEIKMKSLRSFKFNDILDEDELIHHWVQVPINQTRKTEMAPLANEVKYIWNQWRLSQALAARK